MWRLTYRGSLSYISLILIIYQRQQQFSNDWTEIHDMKHIGHLVSCNCVNDYAAIGHFSGSVQFTCTTENSHIIHFKRHLSSERAFLVKKEH